MGNGRVFISRVSLISRLINNFMIIMDEGSQAVHGRGEEKVVDSESGVLSLAIICL